MSVGAEPGRVDAGDVELALLERGEGPLVLCLHGFPDSPWSLVPLLETLADAGFRAVAPAARGYAPSSLPAGRRTTIAQLAADVVAVADALGEEEFSVVGHDWGAITAYAVQRAAPHRVHRAVAASVPPFGAMLRGASPRQLWRSRYMLQFQVPAVPERIVNSAWIDALVRRWSPGWDPTDEQLATIRRGFEGPGNVAAALGYYRGIGPSLVQRDSREVVFGALPVPTLVVRGEEDHCIGAELYDDLESRYDHVELASLPDCGHFVHLEQPEAFADHVLGHLATG